MRKKRTKKCIKVYFCLQFASDGFAWISNCDSGRGVYFSIWDVIGERIFSATPFSSPGQYGPTVIPHPDYDGNATYIRMGTLAKGKTTWAVCGTAEKIYTSDIYKDSPYRSGNYNVFVRLSDQTQLKQCGVDLAGEDRIDMATGKIADTNVIWLTDYDANKKADGVKVVALEDGAYCVLWNEYDSLWDEELYNEYWNFNGVHYVILDERGNTIRRETVNLCAKMDCTNLNPIVNGTHLIWADYDYDDQLLR